jgi:hypothetical protein
VESRLVKVLTSDKEKVEQFIREKREELIELKAKSDVLRETKPNDAIIFSISSVCGRLYSELLLVWGFVELLIGSTFETREVLSRSFELLDKLSKGQDMSLRDEVKELKEKWKDYEPTLLNIKVAIDRAIESQKKGEEAQKKMIA